MKIVFFTHPDFLGSQSMPRFAAMLSEGMKERGHEVEIWSPQPKFFKLSSIGPLKKWLGYIDQFVVFPSELKKRLKRYPPDTLFVFADHALGPWVPLVKDRNHVIHCHDFLAQRSARKEITENPTGFTGRVYQNFIWRGYSKGKNFISVSNKTDQELLQFLAAEPQLHEVVYNGLNRPFEILDAIEARVLMSKITGLDLSEGYILHIGGNQWYKNRLGVIEVYESWRKLSNNKLPLLMIGKYPALPLEMKKRASEFKDDIIFLADILDEQLQQAYSGARLLLFPSLAEGFGWPIAEAMASGCPVVTTNEAPMTEVAGEAAFLIDRKPEAPQYVISWANEAAQIVNKVISLSPSDLQMVIDAGIKNSMRFDTNNALNSVENIYKKILNN